MLEIRKSFTSFDKAYYYYKYDALLSWFSIRKWNIKRLKEGTMRKWYMFYSRIGVWEQSWKNNVNYKRRETRIGYNVRSGVIGEMINGL